MFLQVFVKKLKLLVKLKILENESEMTEVKERSNSAKNAQLKTKRSENT